MNNNSTQTNTNLLRNILIAGLVILALGVAFSVLGFIISFAGPILLLAFGLLAAWVVMKKLQGAENRALTDEVRQTGQEIFETGSRVAGTTIRAGRAAAKAISDEVKK